MWTCQFSSLLLHRRRAIPSNCDNLVYHAGTVPDVYVGSSRAYLGIVDLVCFSFVAADGDLGAVTAGIRAGPNEILHQG
jgi:hypothetical protein